MANDSTRREFLAAGLAIPAAAGIASGQAGGAQSLPPMTYSALGKTGLKVSRLAMGGNAASDVSVFSMAVDLGVNLFDTARSYTNGNSERTLGAVFKANRKNVVLQTKSEARSKDAALRDLEASLREMGTDYLDIWYLHSRNTPAEVNDDLFEAQRLAKQQGKIRFAGVSMHFTMKEMIPFLVQRGQTDVILTAYNFSMPPEMGMEKTLAAARQAGIGIMAMKAMAGGFSRIQRGDRLYTDNPKALTARLKQPGAMVSALKWVLRNKSVDAAVVGILDREQLTENLAAVSAPFGDADQTRLTAQLELIRPLYCRMCGECVDQCKQGLPVGDLLRILSYADGYGQVALARERYGELAAAVQTARCTNCDACTVSCPHGVRVAERVGLAQRWLA
jgi:predicted aldo/keto reductase-like oxidoreductase